MSIKRLNIEERARYTSGEAVMRRIEKSERDPASIVDIRAPCNWIEAWVIGRTVTIVASSLSRVTLRTITLGRSLRPSSCPARCSSRQSYA
jgi:hypothetical protein